MERLIFEKKLELLNSKDVEGSRIGIGFEKLDRAVFDPEKAYDKVAALGVKKVRIQSGWMRTEKEKGKYDFEWLDSIVDNLLSRGLEPWMCLCYGNPLYTPKAEGVLGAVGYAPIDTEEEMQAWLAYVAATVCHFEGRVQLYEIWNEPDCPYAWGHVTWKEFDKVKAAYEYGEFALRTAKIIKESSDTARTIGFALGHLDNFTYVNNAMSTGLYKYLDYVSFHVYSSHDIKREEQTKRFRALLDRYDRGIGLIQGESGAQTRSDGNGAMKGFSWTQEKQLKYLLRTLVCDLYCGVEFTSYFSAMDMIEAHRGIIGNRATYQDFGYFGVISADFDEEGFATGNYTEKPSYYALGALCSLLKGNARACNIPFAVESLPSLRVNGRDYDGDELKIYPFELDDGRRAIIYYRSTDILTATFEGTASFCVYGQDNSQIRLVDLHDGSIYKLPETMIRDMGHGAVRLENIPLTDCPMAIVFG